MAGRLLGGAGSIMGGVALFKILSATTGTGSTLARVAGTLLSQGGGGKGSGRGAGKDSGQGRKGKGESGSLAESLLDAMKELKRDGAGNGKGSGAQGRGQERSRRSAQGEATEPPVTLTPKPEQTTGSEEDQLALTTLAENIASFVDGRVRVRHAGLSSSEAATALQTLLAANGLAASFSPRGSSVLLTYDAKALDRKGFLLRALPLGRYLRDCDQALARRADDLV